MSSGSNTGALRGYTARQMLERALVRAGIKPEQFTAEMAQQCLDEINIMFDEMMNLGMQLWARDQIIIPIYQNVNQCPAPLGTSLILSVNQRSLTRLGAVGAFSTAGGVPANAFDDDFATACTQTSPNGSIGCYFDGATQVTSVGILFATAGTFGIFYEYTRNTGTTWTAIDSADIAPANGEWVWRDLQGVPSDVDGFRIRSVSDNNLAVYELYFGNNPTEIPLGAYNLDDWTALTTKTAPGGLPWVWYQQRDLDTPVLYIWPMPNAQAKYYQFTCWRRRYLDQVTLLTQSMDVSRRWYNALTASLARRLCIGLREADYSRYDALRAEEAEAMSLATGEERDPSPMRFDPGLDEYFR